MGERLEFADCCPTPMRIYVGNESKPVLLVFQDRRLVMDAITEHLLERF